MNICFVTSGLDFNGDSLKTKSLGGSETALASVARELAKRGHNVGVYCRCSQPGRFDDVNYYSIAEFTNNADKEAIDVLVVSRFGELWSPKVKASLNVFWLHDMPGSKETFIPYTMKSDIIFTLSDFHEEQYKDKRYDLSPIMHRTFNGVDMDVIDAAPLIQFNAPTFLYSSLPERGLLSLLKHIWPKIKERIPEAELVIAGYDVTSITSHLTNNVTATREACNDIIEHDRSISALGSLNKTQLYSVMKSCTAMLYPCIWPEIFCITAIESQACGLPIITTNNFALPEVVADGKSGVLVNGRGEEYTAEFVDAAVHVYEDSKWRESVRVSGPEFVRSSGFEWSSIAKQWEELFEKSFKERVDEKRPEIISSMVRAGDILPARLLSNDEKKPLLSTPENFDPSKTKVLGDVDRDVVYQMLIELWKFYLNPKEGETYRLLDIEGNLTWSNFDLPPWVSITKFTDKVSGKFDAVYCGTRPAKSDYPDNALKSYASHLKDDGLLLFNTPTGLLSFFEDDKQKWNLNVEDIRTLCWEQDVFGCVFAHLFHGPRGEKLGYWLTCCSASNKFNRVQLNDRMRRYRPHQTLSACLIAKDEQEWINMALKPVQKIADEIIVVDTGSTDDTVRLAERAGCKVIEAPFEDFATSRNIAMDASSGDWMLWIDCDEQLINGHNVPAYLDCTLPNALVIRQNHLTIDVNNEKKADKPARLVRKKPHYRFVGKIHEHCEDISHEDEFAVPIMPCFEIEDVDIAHYGYVCEPQRRRKNALRNLGMLIEDAKVNLPKGRYMTWMFIMRDCINACKWYFQHIGQHLVIPGSYEHYLLNSACDIYHAIFRGHVEDRPYGPAWRVYQDALAYLGVHQIPYSGTKTIPYQMAVHLQGNHMPFTPDERSAMQPETFWFLDPAEAQEYFDINQKSLAGTMFPNVTKEIDVRKWDFEVSPPDPVALLEGIQARYKRG